jgi:hypothetical protein
MSRSILYAFMAFTTAFVFVFWAVRGFPVRLSWPVPVRPLSPMVNSTFGDQSAKDYERKLWESEHTAQSDGNPRLDAIRLEMLQAANAYAMSPCDETIKANLISALTAYTRAWQNKLNCPRPLNMLMFCSDQRLKETADTFSTPLDRRVKVALEAAFEQKGIMKSDFADDVANDMARFAGPGFWFDPSPICLPRQRASTSASP